MKIYPAIDIKDGRCVRLQQGDMKKVTVYDEIPSRAAARWEEMGAACLHVVDLDGAMKGRLINTKVIGEIIRNVRIPVQLGGGIRDMDTIGSLLNIGVYRVILGTAALRDSGLVMRAVEKYPSRIVIGIDSRDGYVAVEGGRKQAP